MKRSTLEYSMFYGTTPDIFKKAKELRKFETEAEKILWRVLSKNQIQGVQFRRQHPINRFIADFYCHKIKLVIEVDGGIHDLDKNKEYDAERTQLLNKLGIKVTRFTNEQIINNTEIVVKIIKQIVYALLSEASKSPLKGDLGGIEDCGMNKQN